MRRQIGFKKLKNIVMRQDQFRYDYTAIVGGSEGLIYVSELLIGSKCRNPESYMSCQNAALDTQSPPNQGSFSQVGSMTASFSSQYAVVDSWS